MSALQMNFPMSQTSHDGLAGWWFDATHKTYIRVDLATAAKATVTGLVGDEIETIVVSTNDLKNGQFFFAGDGEEPTPIAGQHGVKDWTVDAWWESEGEEPEATSSGNDDADDDEPADSLGSVYDSEGNRVGVEFTAAAPTGCLRCPMDAKHGPVVLKINGEERPYLLRAVHIPLASVQLFDSNLENEVDAQLIGGIDENDNNNAGFVLEVETVDGVVLYAKEYTTSQDTALAIVTRYTPLE